MAFSIEAAMRRLRAADAEGRLAHAYLATASGYDDLDLFARELGGMVLGRSDASPQNHPDYHEVRPESKSRRILVEQMRELEDSLRQKPLLGHRKFAVIHDADRMGGAPANAFLKTLEEPPPDTHILLASILPDALLPTILSRCIHLSLRSGAPPIQTPRQKIAADLARELLGAEESPELPDIFLAVRKFQSLLAEVRQEATGSAEASLKVEKQRYKDRVEGKWIEEREERLSALAEGEVIRERAQLLQAVAGVFAGRLIGDMDEGDARIHRHEALALMQKIDAVNRLRSDLDRTMNEALALEAGFLEIFGKS